jgi:SAM-dependent methyltransferase
MTDALGLPESVVEDLGQLYDEEYYRTGCGPVPYTRSEPQWAAFFGAIADELMRALHPQRVLDAGCALGFLVEAFWDRGIEAWGLDISQYAISQVRRDLQPYCQVGSIADRIEGRYDLITCIEVLEHMPEAQAIRAIENMTRATDTILFSSTPYDINEQTHFNVRPIIAWLHLFREHGFAPDLGFDAAFVCDHAILFRRSDERPSDEVLRLYSSFVRQRHALSEAQSLRSGKQQVERELGAARAQVQLLESAQEEIQANLEAANRQLAALIETRSGRAVPPEPATAAALDNVMDLIKAQAAIVKGLEFRVSGAEQRSAQIAQAVTSILDSRIWRTLVKAGGLIQRLFG